MTDDERVHIPEPTPIEAEAAAYAAALRAGRAGTEREREPQDWSVIDARIAAAVGAAIAAERDQMEQAVGEALAMVMEKFAGG